MASELLGPVGLVEVALGMLTYPIQELWYVLSNRSPPPPFGPSVNPPPTTHEPAKPNQPKTQAIPRGGRRRQGRGTTPDPPTLPAPRAPRRPRPRRLHRRARHTRAGHAGRARPHGRSDGDQKGHHNALLGRVRPGRVLLLRRCHRPRRPPPGVSGWLFGRARGWAGG
jgi:hypothetical protein